MDTRITVVQNKTLSKNVIPANATFLAPKLGAEMNVHRIFTLNDYLLFVSISGDFMLKHKDKILWKSQIPYCGIPNSIDVFSNMSTLSLCSNNSRVDFYSIQLSGAEGMKIKPLKRFLSIVAEPWFQSINIITVDKIEERFLVMTNWRGNLSIYDLQSLHWVIHGDLGSLQKQKGFSYITSLSWVKSQYTLCIGTSTGFIILVDISNVLKINHPRIYITKEPIHLTKSDCQIFTASNSSGISCLASGVGQFVVFSTFDSRLGILNIQSGEISFLSSKESPNLWFTSLKVYPETQMISATTSCGFVFLISMNLQKTRKAHISTSPLIDHAFYNASKNIICTMGCAKTIYLPLFQKDSDFVSSK